MDHRIEKDSMGEVEVPVNVKWGAQTQRSLNNFNIGEEHMPLPLVYAIAEVKKACARANFDLKPEKMTEEKMKAICAVCDEITTGKWNDQFPLKVWQTGSGTQTNMNVNEVIAHVANERAGKALLHPNDDVNMSQSTNDVFPTAIHVAASAGIFKRLRFALEGLIGELEKLEEKGEGVVKTGRTHLQDATPLTFAQEVSGWKAGLNADLKQIVEAAQWLSLVPLGGTAVGTGLNTPNHFDEWATGYLCRQTGCNFFPDENKFKSMSLKDGLVYTHGALKALACNLMKIANDVRFLASGPRCGLGEIILPANEPGSSIMPGKVNPTQCEGLTMICVQVMANDVALTVAASQGNFELNVYMPLMAHTFLQSVRLLTDGMKAFCDKCVSGIEINKERMRENVQKSLMLATALNPVIGYENAAKVANKAYRENLSLRESCVALGYLSAEEFDEIVRPENMV